MFNEHFGTIHKWLKVSTIIALMLLINSQIFGQTAPQPRAKIPNVMIDPNIQQASCSSCGSCGYSPLSPKGCNGYCPTSSCGGCCVPGQENCCSYCDENTNSWQRLCCGLYHGICCNDPCYEPQWLPVANSSFWVDDARPVSHLRLRYDGLFRTQTPDRAEYYVKNDFNADTKDNTKDVRLREVADINEFHIYSETAIGPTFGLFIDMPWRAYHQTENNVMSEFSGFGDLSLGTKSVLLDSEIWLVTFQFKTFIPTGAASNKLGTGHVTLEPAILSSVKMSPDFYIQWQCAWWIPISGKSSYAGPVWHNRIGLNYVLYRILPDVPLIGTLEMVNYNVLSGFYDNGGVLGSGSASTFAVGPGLRMDVCSRVDAGVGTMFSLTDNIYESQAVRVEFRWRY